MRKALAVSAVIMVIMFMAAAHASAQAPNTIMYQGRLTDAEGAPLQEADIDSVRFNVTDTATGFYLPLYDTAVTDLQVDENGVFTIELGPMAPGIFDGRKLYLAIKVNNDTEMAPRQLLTSAPYSFSTFGQVPIGTITAWHKSMTGTPALPDGWVECNGQTIADPESPFDGQVIPDLNGEGRFLKGSGVSGATEDSYLGAHRHKVAEGFDTPTTDASSGHLEMYDASGNLDTAATVVWGGTYSGGPYIDDGATFKPGSYYTHQDVTLADADNAQAVRPRNMSIVWIMRVK
jgi:hypothetical protein